MIHGKLERGHLGIDRDALLGDAIKAVFAEHLVESV